MVQRRKRISSIIQFLSECRPCLAYGLASSSKTPNAISSTLLLPVQAPCSFSPLSFLWNSGTGPPSAGLRDKIQVSSAQSSTFSHPSGYGPACTSQRGRMNRNWWGPPKLSFSWNWILASESDLTCGLTQSISGTIHNFSLSFLEPLEAQPK